MSSDKEMEEKFATEKKTFLKGLFIIAGFAIIAIILALFVGIAGGIIGIIIILIATFIVLYFIWAPNDVFGTFPEEGFAIILVEGMGFKKLFLKFKDFGFDLNWNIVKESDKKIHQKEIKGMCFFLWPFQRRYVYRLKWTKYSEKGESISKQEVLKSVLVKSYVYFVGISSAEDHSLMPINIGLAVEMRIINPVKAIYKIQNWYGSAANFIQGGVRDEIRKRDYIEWINLSESISLGDYFEKEMKDSTIEKIREDFGVEVVKIKVVQIEPSDKRYIEASTRKKLAEFEKEAIVVEADAEKIKRTTEAIGPIIDSISEMTGQSKTEVQSQWKDDPENFEKKYEKSIIRINDLLKAQIAGDKYIKIETSAGGKEGGNPLLELIALSQIISQQVSKNQNPSQTENKKKRSGKEVMEDLGYYD